MSKKILLFFFLSSSYLLNAQYSKVINSNRPGISESPYSVGLGIYQLETVLFYNTSQIVRTFTIPNSFGNNFVFRTSFFDEKLEFNTDFSIQKDEVAFKNVFTSTYTTTGLSKLTFAAKYLVFRPEYEDKSKEIRSWKRKFAFDWKRVIPAVSVYAGINTNLVNDIHKLEGLTPKIGVLLQNDLNSKLNIITNVYYDYIGSSYSEFSYIISGTYIFNDDWSTFLEHQGRYHKYQSNNNFGAGVAFLVNRHFQLDASTRLNFNGKTTESYSSIGFSFRLDRYVPTYKIVDEKGNEIVDDEPNSDKKKNFFGRFFEFFKFKKKNTSDDPNSDTYERKKPERKRIESTTNKAKKKDTKKKSGGFFSFLKKKKKTEEDKKEDKTNEDKKNN